MHRTESRPMEALALDWQVVSRTTTAYLAFTLLSDAEPVVASIGARDMGELVAQLVPRSHPSERCDGGAGGDHVLRSAAVVRAMLRSATLHPFIVRTLVQALVPGLVGISRRLTWGEEGEWNNPFMFFADALSTTWEVVREWAGQDRAYAVLDILSAVRCRLRRRLVADRSRMRAELTPDGEPPGSERATCGQSDLDVLAHTIDLERGRSISERDASVLYAHRVLGLSIAELSKATGRSRRALAGCSGRASESLLT